MISFGRFRRFKLSLVSLIVLGSSLNFLPQTLHADDEPTYEQLIRMPEQPRMKWVKKYFSQFGQNYQNYQNYYTTVDPQTILGELEKLLNTFPDSFIMFHARDTEAVYSWLDAVSLFHPLHEEFMRSFAVVRTSGNVAKFADYSKGTGGIHHNPKGYANHLQKIGLNLGRVVAGKERVVGFIHSGRGLQAVGAYATLLKVFVDHPDFAQIAKNITQNYVVLAYGAGPGLNNGQETIISMLDQLSKEDTPQKRNQILEAAKLYRPKAISELNINGLGGYINWAGSGYDFQEDGTPILNGEGRVQPEAMAHILKLFDRPEFQEQAARMIEKRVAARRVVEGNNKKLKAIKIPKTPPITELNANLMWGSRIAIRSAKDIHVINGQQNTSSNVVIYTLISERNLKETGKPATSYLIVPSAIGDEATIEKMSAVLRQLTKEGLESNKFRIQEKKYIVLSEEAASGIFYKHLVNQTNPLTGTMSLYQRGQKIDFNILSSEQATDTVTYQLQRDAKKVTLTLPKNVFSAENIEKIEKEVRRSAKYDELNIPRLNILKKGVYFILKPLMEGLGMEAWIKQWEADGAPIEASKFENFYQLLNSNAKKGIYLARTVPDYFMFDEAKETWVNTRASAIKTDMNYEQIMAEYQKIFKDRFGEKFVERLTERMAKP